jgi:hypothetical protein
MLPLLGGCHHPDIQVVPCQVALAGCARFHRSPLSSARRAARSSSNALRRSSVPPSRHGAWRGQTPPVPMPLLAAGGPARHRQHAPSANGHRQAHDPSPLTQAAYQRLARGVDVEPAANALTTASRLYRHTRLDRPGPPEPGTPPAASAQLRAPPKTASTVTTRPTHLLPWVHEPSAVPQRESLLRTGLILTMDRRHSAVLTEVVPRLVDLEVAVPHLSPAIW